MMKQNITEQYSAQQGSNMLVGIQPRACAGHVENFQNMSYAALLEHVKNSPIISVPEGAEGMSLAVGYSAVIQTNAVAISVQPDVRLDGVPSLDPSQEGARQYVSIWFDEVLPGIFKLYTRVKFFGTLIGSLTDADINEIVDDRDMFPEVMNMFTEEARRYGLEVIALAEKLSHFANAFSMDVLHPFSSIKTQVDATYGNSIGGEVSRLQAGMVALQTILENCNFRFAYFAATDSSSSVTLTSVMIALLTEPLRLLFAYLSASPAPIGIPEEDLIERARKARHQYIQKAEELNKLQFRCAALQVLADVFNSFTSANVQASLSLSRLSMYWNKVGQEFQNLVDNPTDPEVIKLRLKTAREDALRLKEIAQRLELLRVIPIAPEENIASSLGLPRFLKKNPINANEFIRFVTAHVGLGRYGRSYRDPKNWTSKK